MNCAMPKSIEPLDSTKRYCQCLSMVFKWTGTVRQYMARGKTNSIVDTGQVYIMHALLAEGHPRLYHSGI